MTAPHPPRLADDALSMVLETALDAAIVMNAEGEIVAWSRKAEQVFGWLQHDVLGRRMADLIIPPRYREAHELGLRRYLATGRATLLGQRIEITAMRRDLEEFPVELSIQELAGESGLQFLGFVRDITERHRAEKRLARQAHEAALMHRLTLLAAGDAPIEEVLRESLAAICTLTEWPLGHAFIPSGSGFLQPTNIWHSGPGDFEEFKAATEQSCFAKGQALPGRAWAAREAVWVSDVDDADSFPRLQAARNSGLRSGFAFPLFVSGQVAAVPEFFTDKVTAPDPDTLHLVAAPCRAVGPRTRTQTIGRSSAHGNRAA